MIPLRVSVWGLGQHAIKRLLPAIAGTQGLALYGVCSRDQSKVSASMDRWGCKGWTDAAAMLGDLNADVVFVAAPIGLHGEYGKQVLLAGKHLWCEKPLTCLLRDTLGLIETSRHLELTICEGFMYLHHPQFKQLRGYAAGGRLGSIKSICCSFGIPPLDHPGFRTDPALGGGALFDVGCYPISAIQALDPEGTPAVGFADMRSSAGSMVDTDGHAVLTLTNGTVARLEWGTGRAYRNEIDIWGQKGSLYTDRIFSKSADYVPAFLLRDQQGAEIREVGQAGDHFVAMLTYFRSLIADSRAAEAERVAIGRRAKLIDDICLVSRSRQSGGGPRKI